MFSRRGERALARERADVHLVDDLPLERRAAPVVVSPLEGGRVYDPRSSVRAVGLEARGRVWVEAVVSVEAEAVERAILQTFGEAGEVAALLLSERERLGRALALEDDRHLAPARSPHAEVDAARGQRLGPYGQSPRRLRRLHPRICFRRFLCYL